MRPLRTVIRFIFPALLCLLAGSLHAQAAAGAAGSAGNSAANAVKPTLYQSPNISAFGVPTGLITVDISSTSKYFQSNPTAVTDPLSPVSATSVLGCGGVGQGEYTSALFNMPEVMSKFQTDVNSPLAKNLLTMNYSLPQTAALFDTLNAYGNQRYDQFQRGCSLDALKQDAKQRYLEACVAEQIPLRQSVITSANPTVKDPLLSSEAYAQAWEICQMQYVSNTQALAQRVSVATAFAKEMRTAEYANTAIRGLLCPNSTSACWQALFLPQVRICIGSSLEKNCTDGEYGVEEAPLRMLPFFDALRLAVTEGINKDFVIPLVSQINSKGIPPSVQRSAAAAAAAAIADQPRDDNSTAKLTNLSDFKNNYLNCAIKTADLSPYPLQKYVEELNKQLSANGNNATSITLGNANVLQIETVTALLKLPEPDNAALQTDKKALDTLIPMLVGCVANQTIPVLDPVIIAETNSKCSADDLTAFYSVASYDLAITATRETYLYLISRLRDIKARLLVEDTRPDSKNANGDDVVNSGGKLASKELNQRLATIVGELMIPRLQAQLDRLDELTKARGEFGTRVKQIYATKTGCVYNQK